MKKSMKISAVVAAMLFTAGVSAQGLGLRVGFGASLATDMHAQGSHLKLLGGLGGTGLDNSFADAPTTLLEGKSSEGTANSISGIDMNLKVEYDVLDWLYVRTGFGYTMGLKNTYKVSLTQVDSGWAAGGFSAAGTGANGTKIDSSATATATATAMEIPFLVGLNLLETDKSTIYFAAGPAWVSGSVTGTMEATQTGTTVINMENEISVSTLGFMSIIGGRVMIAENISLFGEVKFLSAAKVGEDFSTYTSDSGTTARETAAGAVMVTANDNSLFDDIASTSKAKKTGGLDMSYTRWQLGVDYHL